jgi:hypothetical protein
MIFKLIATAIVCTICSCVSLVVAQQPSQPGIRTPAVIEFQGDMRMLLAALPDSYGVTIGLELDMQQHPVLVRVSLKDDPSLADVMNAIVTSARTYHWREADGFVEVLPLAGSNSLLETRINSFKSRDVNEGQAFDLLFGLPEVYNTMQALNLQRRSPNWEFVRMTGNRFPVDLEGATVRHALNKIAQGSGNRFWIFSNYRNGTFSISTLTR